MKISSDRDLFLVIDTSNIFLVISLLVRADNTIEDDRFDNVECRILAAFIQVFIPERTPKCTRDLHPIKITTFGN